MQSNYVEEEKQVQVTNSKWMVTVGSVVIDIRKVIYVGPLKKEGTNWNTYKVLFDSGYEIEVVDNGGNYQISMKRTEFLRRWAESGGT
jgi:hypothetical protein